MQTKDLRPLPEPFGGMGSGTLAGWIREKQGADRAPPSARVGAGWAFRTLVCPLLGYLLLAPVLWSVCRLSIYPGQYIPKLNHRDQPAGSTAFSFVSSHDGAVLSGGRMLYRWPTAGPTAEVVPLVFLGGNGGNVWFNMLAAGGLVAPALNATLGFEVYTYSFRGYAPNDDYSASEGALIEDSISLFEHVAARHNGSRPLLMAHSLGTGSAIAVADRLLGGGGGGGGPACLLLGSPFASMHQVALEMTFFVPWPWIYLADSWKSAERLAHVPADMPFIVLSPSADALIPPHFHKEVYDAGTMPSGSRKWLFEEPGAGHNAM
eukprot:SAG22_NODE_5644_length_978_cov_1.423208_1_plen_320_part_01